MAEKTTYVIALNDKLSPGLKKATAKALGLDKAMGRAGGKGKRSMGGLAGSIKGLIGPLALATAAWKAYDFAASSIQVARKFESLTNAINFASGGLEEGAKSMEFLRERSELLGSDLLASTEGFKTLSAAMLGSKLEGQATRDIFDGVQVASTAMGLSSEDAKGTFLALGQIMGKGKVQAEELRGQIGERIPGAFNIAARAMGVTTAELNKMMETGNLLAEDFLPKFSNELKKTFGKALPTAAQSSQAQFNRFNNSMLELKITLGNKLMPIINKSMALFKKVFSFFKINAAIIGQALEPLTGAWISIKDLAVDFFSKLSGGATITETLQNAFSMLQKGLTFLQPVISGIVGVWGALFDSIINVKNIFFSLLERFPIIKDSFKILGGSIKDVFIGILSSAKHILSGVGNLLEGIFSGNVDKIKEGLSGIKKAFIEEDKNIGQRVLGRNLKNKPLVLKQVLEKKKGGFSDVLKQSGLGVGGKGGAAGATTGKAGKKSSTSIDGVKSGRPTNIHININKMIESFNVTATNLEDINNKAKDLVAQALLSAVNNVNNIAQ